MRFGVFTDESCSLGGRYQLMFQGEILSKDSHHSMGKGETESKGSLHDVMARIRPGQFSIVAQDLDFEGAKKQMKRLIALGIITYIEPMGQPLTLSKSIA